MLFASFIIVLITGMIVIEIFGDIGLVKNIFDALGVGEAFVGGEA